MTAAKEKLSRAIDTALPILILLQVSLVSISIAASSIMFATWMTLWLVQLIIDRNRFVAVFRLPSLRSINLFIILYFITEVVSRIFAVIPEHAFDNIKRLLLFGIFYACIAKVSGTFHAARLLTALLAILSAISLTELATYAVKFGELIQTTPFSEIRIDYYNYPLTSAEIKLMVLMAFLPVIFRSGDFVIRRGYLIALCAPVIVSMLLTQSRNVYLALFLCLLVYGLIWNRKLVLVMLALVIMAFAVLPSSFTSRLRSIADAEHPSNRSRLIMWETGWKIFLDHPVTGIADSDFRKVYETYRMPVYHGEGVHLHNNVLMILVTTGIPGLLAFAGLFTVILIQLIKIYRRFRNDARGELVLGSIFVVLSFQIAGIFEWNFGDHEVMTVFFFLLSIPFIIDKQKAVDTNELLSS